MTAPPAPSSSSASGSDGEIQLEGYLFKKGDVGAIKTWKKRWFYLHKNRLFYYIEKPQDAKVGHGAQATKAKGFIPLADVESIETLTGRKFGFQVKTLERIYLLQAPSGEVRQYWIDNLNRAVETAKKQSRQDENSLAFEDRESGSVITMRDVMRKDGYLTEKTLWGWKKRWCVLKDGLLRIYADKNLGTPEKVPLYEADLADFAEKQNAFQITHSKQSLVSKKVILQAETDMAMQEWCTAIIKQKFVIEMAINSIEIA